MKQNARLDLVQHRNFVKLMRALSGEQLLALCQLKMHGPVFFRQTSGSWSGLVLGGPTADKTMRSLLRRRLANPSKPTRGAPTVRLSHDGKAFLAWLGRMVPR